VLRQCRNRCCANRCRTREIAVRSALGLSAQDRAAIAHESVLLASTGGLLGMALERDLAGRAVARSTWPLPTVVALHRMRVSHCFAARPRGDWHAPAASLLAWQATGLSPCRP
jgi:hypothetical protein